MQLPDQVGTLLVTLLDGVVTSVIATPILQKFTQWMRGFRPFYVAVFIASLVVYATTYSILPLMNPIVRFQETYGLVGMLLSTSVAMFIIGSVVFGRVIKHPIHGAVGFKFGISAVLMYMFVVYTLRGIFIALGAAMRI